MSTALFVRQPELAPNVLRVCDPFTCTPPTPGVVLYVRNPLIDDHTLRVCDPFNCTPAPNPGPQIPGGGGPQEHVYYEEAYAYQEPGGEWVIDRKRRPVEVLVQAGTLAVRVEAGALAVRAQAGPGLFTLRGGALNVKVETDYGDDDPERS